MFQKKEGHEDRFVIKARKAFREETLWCSLISRPGSIIWPMLV